MAEGILGQKALAGTAGKRGSEDELVNPVGRRESLDASHQAQNLQAALRESRCSPTPPPPPPAAPQRPGACWRSSRS